MGKAKVKLYTHNVSSWGPFLSMIGQMKQSMQGGKHWAIVVQFDGEEEVWLCQLSLASGENVGKGKYEKYLANFANIFAEVLIA